MSATENTELLERLKALSEKHNKAIAALESIAFAKPHIWNRQDLSDKAMNALIALGEYQRVNKSANAEVSHRDPKSGSVPDVTD